MKHRVSETFATHFGQPPPLLVRAPGRVNLIGEHTDYNDGFVLPMAIDRAVWIALRPRPDAIVRVFSIEHEGWGQFNLATFSHENAGWLEYIKGTAWSLQGADHQLQGWEGVMAGDVPIGAGLSSSAALEMATARAFAAVSGLAWQPASMALLGQKAENKWVGVNCGIMDQMISAAGEAKHALLIDCRSLETESVPLPPDTTVVVMDTATRRGLVDSAYNERRAQCEEAAAYFGVQALRDVSFETFTAKAAGLDPLTRRRARHVITENDRTLAAVEAMRQGDAFTLGQLMNDSHISLRDDFEVSSPELDIMVEIAQGQQGCYGARMTGAGFGGCAVALVQSAAADTFAQTIARSYQAATQLEPSIYVCEATNGAELIVS
jgi:galactokinase